MDPVRQWSQWLTRRHFFGRSAWGIGTCALATLLGRPARAATESVSGGLPHFAARARRVIYIFRAGGPAQMETYDYKPRLAELHGQPVPPSVIGDQRLTQFSASEKQLSVVAPPYRFAQYGESGAWVSELFPHMAGMVDDVCFIKSMHTESVNHDPALTYLMTGLQHPGRPSVGAWTSYGLGTDNQNLPAFAVLLQSSKIPDAGTPVSAVHWGSGFLPSQHQGVKLRAAADPVLYLNNPPGIDREARRWMLDAGVELNRLQYEAVGDPEINTRIAQYELAYRMQTSVPELTDLSSEPQHVFDLYGPDSRTPGTYAANCLLARRLTEAGVRFVQLFDRDWDHHRNLKKHMPRKAGEVDQPTAALLRDLKHRGLLQDTLVMCSGEFGRSVYCQGKLQDNYGRDHHGRCFTAWMAGGGVRAGQTVGATDDFCFNVTADPVHVHDFNATVLHLLGIDHERLTFRHQGRDHRLTDVHGKVVRKIIA
jgi:hypothetical protein